MCVARRLSAARGRKVIGVPVRQRSTGRGGRTERRRARRRAHEDLRGRLGRGTPAKQGAPARARARARTRRHRAPSPPPSLPHLHTVVCFSLAERGRSANLPRTQKNAVHEHSPRTRPTNTTHESTTCREATRRGKVGKRSQSQTQVRRATYRCGHGPATLLCPCAGARGRALLGAPARGRAFSKRKPWPRFTHELGMRWGCGGPETTLALCRATCGAEQGYTSESRCAGRACDTSLHAAPFAVRSSSRRLRGHAPFGMCVCSQTKWLRLTRASSRRWSPATPLSSWASRRCAVDT
jgi:hypothetical protein